MIFHSRYIAITCRGNCKSSQSSLTTPNLRLPLVKFVGPKRRYLATFSRRSVALLTLWATSSFGALIQVPQDVPTIQAAIDAANIGDLVSVSPGTYLENIVFSGKNIPVVSVAGPSKTILDGGGKGAVVSFLDHENPAAVLSGFTIQHGKISEGAVELSLASPTISGNIFRNNGLAVASGAAIDGNSSSPRINRNMFFGNTCDSQFSSGVISFHNFSSPTITNNVFVRNGCRAITMILPEGNSPVIANNTIVMNTVGVRIFGQIPTSTQLYANNILVGNGTGLEIVNLLPNNEPTWANNLVYLNATNYSGIASQTGLNGNISVDPLFLPTNSRYTFQVDRRSPAIDAGTIFIPGLPSVDFIGSPRVIDGNGNGVALPDIGAYEFIPEWLGLDHSSNPRTYR